MIAVTKKSLFGALCGALALLSGCDVVKQVGGAYMMTQCNYAFNSVSGVTLVGIDLSKKLSPIDLLKVTPLLTGKATSVPMGITVHVDVTNPNKMEAMLQGLQYIMSVDGVQFTTGQVNTPLSVPAASTKTMPLTLGFDLATLLSGQARDATVGVVKNLVGINNKKSNVKFEIKPSFKIGNQVVASPVYIPLNFTL